MKPQKQPRTPKQSQNTTEQENAQKQPQTSPEPKLTTASDLHPQSFKENPETWYTEKNRISIVHIQTPTDETTEYYYTDQQINQELLTYILAALILFFTGAFL